jgi:hypothetical protein
MSKVSLAGGSWGGQLCLHRARERVGVLQASALGCSLRKSLIFSAHAPRSFMHLLSYKKEAYTGFFFVCGPAKPGHFKISVQSGL